MRAKWSRDEDSRTGNEYREILMMIQKCYRLAHDEAIDCAFKEINLSISVQGRIECKKLRSIARTLTRDK